MSYLYLLTYIPTFVVIKLLIFNKIESVVQCEGR